MQKFSITQRTKMVVLFFENGRSIIATQRAYKKFYGVRNVPTGPTIRAIVAKFEQYGNVGDVKRVGRPRSGRSIDNIQLVRKSVSDNPETSTRRRSKELSIQRGTIRQILKEDLLLYPYKIQLVQKIYPSDLKLRFEYSRAVLNLVANDQSFLENFMMTDEAHFHLSGFVNKQNYRFWGTENPRNVQQHLLHPLRVTVWCGITSSMIYGPYFFENDAGESIAINGDRYRTMLQDFLFPLLRTNNNIGKIWFQQDGATAHTAHKTISLLHGEFQKRVISKNGDLNWPPRSPDLSAADFFLWGYLKDRVYINNPQTLRELKDNIQAEIAKITLVTLQKVLENAMKRANECLKCNGGHLNNIIFHS